MLSVKAMGKKESVALAGAALPPSLPPPPDDDDDDDDEQTIKDRKKASFEYTESVLLGKRIKSTLSDGRTLTGILICIDRLKNLILTNVIEERLIDPADYRYRVDGAGDSGTNNATANTGADADTNADTNAAADTNADAGADADTDTIIAADEKPTRTIDGSGGGSRLRKVERRISQAMIPGSRLIKVEIAKSLLR